MKTPAIATLVSISLAFAIQAQPADTTQQQPAKTLFVYDKIDESSQLFVNAFRRQLNEQGVSFDEAIVDSGKIPSISSYNRLVIYSRVMAFNMMSSVRKWIGSLPSLEEKKIYIFVTANRWFKDDHRRQIVKLVSDRQGTIVDAVSMATDKLTIEQKTDPVKMQILKLKE